jgi:hypothetical protein
MAESESGYFTFSFCLLRDQNFEVRKRFPAEGFIHSIAGNAIMGRGRFRAAAGLFSAGQLQSGGRPRLLAEPVRPALRLFPQSKKASSSVDQLIPWLLDDAGQLPSISEVSSDFEDLPRELPNRVPGFSCDFPRTSEDRVQRSGHPDLRLVETATNRIFYLDPKLYAAGSRDSSFRTFYFEPKITTNKVRDDAVHLLVGFEHTPPTAGHWTFTRWDPVDLAHFKVRLKAEFQGSNRDSTSTMQLSRRARSSTKSPLLTARLYRMIKNRS